MASESDASLSALIQTLIATPLFSAVPDSNSDPDQSLGLIIVINPVTQQLMLIGGSGTDFDSVLNDIIRKEEGESVASQASIDGLPVTEVKGEEEIESLGEGGQSECVICLEEWGVGDVAKEMPCQHKFHDGCVEKWLKINGSCPVCRHKMPVAVDDNLDKKIGDESGIRGRRIREIWVTFAVHNRRPISEEESESELYE